MEYLRNRRGANDEGCGTTNCNVKKVERVYDDRNVHPGYAKKNIG